MSKALPISLRIASKTRCFETSGDSSYYYSSQLLSNLAYLKIASTLGQQFAWPSKQDPSMPQVKQGSVFLAKAKTNFKTSHLKPHLNLNVTPGKMWLSANVKLVEKLTNSQQFFHSKTMGLLAKTLGGCGRFSSLYLFNGNLRKPSLKVPDRLLRGMSHRLGLSCSLKSSVLQERLSTKACLENQGFDETKASAKSRFSAIHLLSTHLNFFKSFNPAGMSHFWYRNQPQQQQNLDFSSAKHWGKPEPKQGEKQEKLSTLFLKEKRLEKKLPSLTFLSPLGTIFSSNNRWDIPQSNRSWKSKQLSKVDQLFPLAATRWTTGKVSKNLCERPRVPQRLRQVEKVSAKQGEKVWLSSKWAKPVFKTPTGLPFYLGCLGLISHCQVLKSSLAITPISSGSLQSNLLLANYDQVLQTISSSNLGLVSASPKLYISRNHKHLTHYLFFDLPAGPHCRRKAGDFSKTQLSSKKKQNKTVAKTVFISAQFQKQQKLQKKAKPIYASVRWV